MHRLIINTWVGEGDGLDGEDGPNFIDAASVGWIMVCISGRAALLAGDTRRAVSEIWVQMDTFHPEHLPVMVSLTTLADSRLSGCGASCD